MAYYCRNSRYGRLFAYGLSRGLGGLAHFVYVAAWGLSMIVYSTVPGKYLKR